MTSERLSLEEGVNESILLGEKVGGKISRDAAKEYASAKTPEEKRAALVRKTMGLIIQNPHSGFGLGTGDRRYRFGELTSEYFWVVPRE